jgi:hypothetical protein
VSLIKSGGFFLVFLMQHENVMYKIEHKAMDLRVNDALMMTVDIIYKSPTQTFHSNLKQNFHDKMILFSSSNRHLTNNKSKAESSPLRRFIKTLSP